MSEETSPSSVTGTSGNQSEASSTPSPDGPGTRLVVLKQPPTHVFKGEWFDVQVGLDALRGFSPQVPVDAEFDITLHPYGSEEPADPSMLTIEPPRIHLTTLSTSERRQHAFKCMINETGEESSTFVIRISPKVVINGLKSVSTRLITLARLKLAIKDNQGWEPVWFKDEGGRDKCMSVVVGLYNERGMLETGEKLPLQLMLCYDNRDEPVHVSRQEIFRIIGSSRHYIEKKSGTAVVRFRIEDVSKNHQGQEFRVKVAPDPKATGIHGVAPAYTPPVSVRSKRNKRQRSGATKAETRGPSPLSGRSPPPFARGEAFASGADDPASLAGVDMSRLREAMKGLISWTDDVVNGLYPLQWYVIGYAQHPDGTPDYSRPYHSMPNPNATISRVLSTYSESTRENLRVLLSAIDKSNPGPGARVGSPFALEGSSHPMLPPPMDPRTPPSQAPFVQRAASFQSIPGEGLRDKGDSDLGLGFVGQLTPGLSPPRQSQLLYSQSTMSQPGSGPFPLYPHESRLTGANLRPTKTTGLERAPIQVHEMSRPRRSYDEESRESEVEYVLARQFKALRTGERLGFPAYSASKELLGFFRESNVNAGVNQFVPISRHAADFGQMEILQAAEILEEEIANKSGALHSLKDFGSISTLMDNALVYDWTKDIQRGSSSTS